MSVVSLKLIDSLQKGPDKPRSDKYMAKIANTPKTTKLQRTAYHEAGHAVMCLEEKRRFHHVTIVPDEERGSLGHLLHIRRSTFDPESMDPRQARKVLEADILCSLAGPAAEAKYAGRRNWQGARGDLKNMADYAMYCVSSAEEASAFVSWLWIRAQNTMSAQWVLVEAIADALIERKTLSYPAAKKAIHNRLFKPVVISKSEKEASRVSQIR